MKEGCREEEKRSGYSEKHSKTRKIMAQNRKRVAQVARNNCLCALGVRGKSRKLSFCGGDKSGYFGQITPRRQMPLMCFLLSVLTKMTSCKRWLIQCGPVRKRWESQP